jgi:hypothetical protein
MNEEPVLRYTQSDLLQKLKERSTLRTTLVDIGRICKDKWKLEPKNSTYKKWRLDSYIPKDGSIKQWLNHDSMTGRFFTFDDLFFEKQ